MRMQLEMETKISRRRTAAGRSRSRSSRRRPSPIPLPRPSRSRYPPPSWIPPPRIPRTCAANTLLLLRIVLATLLPALLAVPVLFNPTITDIRASPPPPFGLRPPRIIPLTTPSPIPDIFIVFMPLLPHLGLTLYPHTNFRLRLTRRDRLPPSSHPLLH
ncbi:hypothetical protein R3P38DRAFT_2933544 [Favolaschia claudopus]|uniref:Uncharacterized protein n=1 Tax=Favolaschia claudopus TaxID=2862362 RepID=A0AAW0BUM2_9AGAR